MCIGKSSVLVLVPKERNNQIFLLEEFIERDFELQNPILKHLKAWHNAITQAVSIWKKEILINEICLPRLINCVINELSLINQIINLCNHHSCSLTNRRLHEQDVLLQPLFLVVNFVIWFGNSLLLLLFVSSRKKFIVRILNCDFNLNVFWVLPVLVNHFTPFIHELQCVHWFNSQFEADSLNLVDRHSPLRRLLVLQVTASSDDLCVIAVVIRVSHQNPFLSLVEFIFQL